MVDFMANMTRWAVPIDQQMDQLMQQQINENREKMKSIIKTISYPDAEHVIMIFNYFTFLSAIQILNSYSTTCIWPSYLPSKSWTHMSLNNYVTFLHAIQMLN